MSQEVFSISAGSDINLFIDEEVITDSNVIDRKRKSVEPHSSLFVKEKKKVEFLQKFRFNMNMYTMIL